MKRLLYFEEIQKQTIPYTPDLTILKIRMRNTLENSRSFVKLALMGLFV